MNKVKKNNKGFSLVELIVVVLIMAIIAVSLAPQVMKWVNNARIATDRQTVDAVISYAQMAMTDKDAYASVYGTGTTIEINTTKTTVNNSALLTAFEKIAGDADDIKFKTTGATVTITIGTDGIVQKPTYSVGDALYSADLDN